MANSGLNFTWGPPDPKVLHFSNCSLAVDYYLSYIAGYDYPYESGGALLRNGLSSYLQNGSFDAPPLYELAQWYDSLRNSEPQNPYSSKDLRDIIANWIEEHCLRELCPQLGWQGNSDVAGRGMVVTYIIQAVLVTIYVPILLGIRFDRIPKCFENASVAQRLIAAVQHSTETFLNASFVFCNAMLLAAIVACAQMFGDLTTTTSPIIMALMATYSIIPPVLLQMAASRMLRRRKGRRIIWLFISVVVIALMILLVFVLNSDTTFDTRPGSKEYPDEISKEQQKQRYWEDHCTYDDSIEFAWSILTPILTSCSAIAVVYIIRFGILVFRPPKKQQSKQHWKCWRLLWWIALVLNFIIMWFILAWFVHFRAKSDIMGGFSNKEVEWSFGQILSLATWLPVVLEMGYIWWQRPVEALNGRLMDPFEVVHVASSEDARELVRRETV